MIGDDIKITISEFRKDGGGQKVRIGIDAPKGVTVHRLEIYEAIKNGVANVAQTAVAGVESTQTETGA